MARTVRVGAAQLGPITKDESRERVVVRLLALLDQAKGAGCELVVYPELALTTFFSRWVMDDPADANPYCETAMPNPVVQPLFDRARAYGIGFYIGYAELTQEDGEERRYNTSILVDPSGTIVGKYRKVHIPGLPEADPTGCAVNFEKRYFTDGNLGFPVFQAFDGVMGMALCNDRRWPETYRVMALQGAELIMLGYNTGSTRMILEGNRRTLEPTHLAMFHNHLTMQAGAYQNACWVVGVAKAGHEEGEDLMGGSCIIAPTGEIVALARTLDDELIFADCDLDACAYNRRTIFNFDTDRRIQHYGRITGQRGIINPFEAAS
jgi:N-carbamoyl-D-amino-acid hydrolase